MLSNSLDSNTVKVVYTTGTICIPTITIFMKIDLFWKKAANIYFLNGIPSITQYVDNCQVLDKYKFSYDLDTSTYISERKTERNTEISETGELTTSTILLEESYRDDNFHIFVKNLFIMKLVNCSLTPENIINLYNFRMKDREITTTHDFFIKFPDCEYFYDLRKIKYHFGKYYLPIIYIYYDGKPVAIYNLYSNTITINMIYFNIIALYLIWNVNFTFDYETDTYIITNKNRDYKVLGNNNLGKSIINFKRALLENEKSFVKKCLIKKYENQNKISENRSEIISENRNGIILEDTNITKNNIENLSWRKRSIY